MNQAQLRYPQEYSKAALSLAATASNSAQNGATVDHTGYQSMIADYVYSASGTPTGGTITLQLQDSSDGVTFANYGAPVTANLVGFLTGGVVSLPMDISGARIKIRVISTGAPTGGASPVVTASGTLRLFGPDRWPAI